MSDKFYLDPGELDEVIAWVNELKQSLSPGNSQNMYRAVGEYMRQQTLQNFEGEHAPDGEKWAPLSEVTKARRRQGKGVSSDRILQDTGALRGSIGYKVSPDGVIIGTVKGNLGTVLRYANAHQYGIPRSMMKQIRVSTPDRNGRYFSRMMNVPWGPIPARPYVGVTQRNLDRIASIIERYILKEDAGGEN